MKNLIKKMEDQKINEEVSAEVEATEVEQPQAAPTSEEQRNVLLGAISYTNENDYEGFLQNLDMNQAIFVLIASANYGQAKGLYNLDEGELVARAIKTIRRNSAQEVEKAEQAAQAEQAEPTSESESN
jgi:hypothetical protein